MQKLNYDFNKFKLIYKDLLESGGVAAEKYQEQISYIIWLVMHDGVWNNQDFMIQINDDLVQNDKKPIDIADEVTFAFFFKHNVDTQAMFIPEETVINPKTKEIKSIYLEITVNIEDIKKQEVLLTSLIYHELNHCIDDINKIKKNLPSLKDIVSVNVDYKKVIADITNDNMTFPYIIYRLFVDTELNALIAQLYGELTVVKPNRCNISDKIKNTEVFDIFKIVSTFYMQYVNTESISWVPKVKRYFPTKQKLSDNKFKKWFKTQYLQRAKVLWYKLWKAGYYYLDKNESFDYTLCKRKFYNDTLRLYYSLNESLKSKYRKLHTYKTCTITAYSIDGKQILFESTTKYIPIFNILTKNDVNSYINTLNENQKYKIRTTPFL